MAAPTSLPQASGSPKTGSRTESNSEKVAAAIRQQEARFEQRTDELIAQLYLARAEAAHLRQQSQQLQQEFQQKFQQVRGDDGQTQRSFENAKHYYDQASSDAGQTQRSFENAQRGFAQAQHDHEQLQRDYELLRALLQASQDALLHARPLSPERQRQIEAALHPGAPPAPAAERRAA